MKILLVEDDAFFAQRIAELLRDRNIDATSVRSATDVLSVNAQSFDGAIVDVMLENDAALTGITDAESRGGFLTGVAVARRLINRNSAIRIVLLSAVGEDSEAAAWAAEHSISFVGKDEGSSSLLRALGSLGLIAPAPKPSAFIVHGHDEVALLELKNYIQNTLKWPEPIVLREQPSRGKTLIEKFEDYSGRIDCVFVLVTPDDKTLSASNDERRRSRQNVIFELGFFYGSLNRSSGRILLLHKGPIELPSDISGIVWMTSVTELKPPEKKFEKKSNTSKCKLRLVGRLYGPPQTICPS